jgi:hypothetical protein
MQNTTTPKEINMTEEEVRAIVATMEQEKLYPCFAELRKRVIEGLPRLLGRECPEIIAVIPRIPFSPDLEGVSRRLIDGGTIWGPNNYSPVISSAWVDRSFAIPRFNSNEYKRFNTNEPELGQLRAKVLEALPVLLGWLKAHEVMTMIPISPLNSMTDQQISIPNLKGRPFPGWICGTAYFHDL